MRRSTLAATLGAWLALCPAGPARAQETAKPFPCREDAEKLCKNVRPGEGRIIECLKKQPPAKLSRACGRWLANQAVFSKACGKDSAALCKDVVPGGGRVYDCLLKHRSRLSSDCLKQLLGPKLKKKDPPRAR